MRARAILKSAPIVDGHNDVPWSIRESKTRPRDLDAYDLRQRTPGDTDIPRLRQGGVGGQFWSVYIPAEDKTAGYARMQLEQIELARRMIAKYPQDLGLALSADDIEREWKRGRIASLLGMEGGHAIENSLGALRAYYDLGARYMTLTHGATLDWADAAGDPPRHGGLTKFGEEVVREMNRLGMLVDLSHVTPETMDDALRVAEAPVIFSHSSARALCDVPRNVPGRHPGPRREERRRRDGDVRGLLHLERPGQGVGGALGGVQAALGHRRQLAGARAHPQGDLRRSWTCPRPRSRRSPTTSSTCARSRASTASGWAATTTATTTGRSAWRTSRSTPISSRS